MQTHHALLALIVIAALSCDKKKETTAPGNGSGSVIHHCDPDSIYFQRSVLPFLTSACGANGCHDAVTGSPDLTTYAGIMGVVVPGDTMNSALVTTAPHWTVDSLTARHMDSVAVWIAQGARNNTCVP